jgi:hypothetical protein
MVLYAIEEEAEGAAWDVWVSLYPGFTKDTFVPFSEFKDSKIKTVDKKKMSLQEVEAEALSVVCQYQARKESADK